MTESALTWENVNFSARQGFWMKSKRILHDMDISVPVGSVLGLLGANGAGKTTTIKLGAGLLIPESGSVRIKGHSASDAKARACMGLLTENQYVYPHLKLREWLFMLAELSGIKSGTAVQRTSHVLEMFELSGRSEQLMRTLSKGQLQRAGLAQVFLHEPEILMLDEPMSGLDPYWRYRVQKILLDFKAAGGSILFSSHILIDVERLSDRIVFIKEGRIHWQGSLSELPRKTKGYEAICSSRSSETLRKIAEKGQIEMQPGGQWRFSISEGQKERVLQMASEGSLILESLRPVQEETEEILFGFKTQAAGIAENKGE